MTPLGIYLLFFVFAVPILVPNRSFVAPSPVSGSSNSEIWIKAKLFQENLVIPCLLSIGLPFRSLMWYICRTRENCESYWDKSLIGHTENNNTVLFDFQGLYGLDAKGNLTIRKVLPKINGTGYRCEAEYPTIGRVDQQVLLEIVKEPPKIITPSLNTVWVPEGMPLDLKFEVVGFPIPHTTLTRNHELLQNQTSTECRYIKPNSTTDDKGFYNYRAENPFGSVNYTLEVKVFSIQRCWSPHSGDVRSPDAPDPPDSPPSGTSPPPGDVQSSDAPDPPDSPPSGTSLPPGDVLSSDAPDPPYSPSSVTSLPPGDILSSDAPGPPYSPPSGTSLPPGDCRKQMDFVTAIKNPTVLTLIVLPSVFCVILLVILMMCYCSKYGPNRREQCIRNDFGNDFTVLDILSESDIGNDRRESDIGNDCTESGIGNDRRESIIGNDLKVLDSIESRSSVKTPVCSDRYVRRPLNPVDELNIVRRPKVPKKT